MPRISATPRTSSWIGERGFVYGDRDTGRLRDLVQDGRHAAARCIAHEMHVDAGREQGSGQSVQRHRVAPEVLGLEVHIAAGEHHGAAVVPHRAAERPRVPAPHAGDRDTLRQCHDPDTRRRDEELVCLAPGHDLRIAGDDADTRAIGRPAHRLDHSAQSRDVETFLEDERRGRDRAASRRRPRGR